ncbi:MAG TPA: methyltransferase, partial [Chryseobacterium sp.]|nr:methyltransferase [Chryseobacterium sp.]
IPDFPGRSWSAELIKAGELTKGRQFNIISRNHPLTPEQIKKKYGLRDGGDLYLIFTQSVGGKQILRCTPV